MSNTFNTRVATDLTDCQNSILREEKSLLQRKIPPAAASAPPARLKVTTTTLQTMFLHIPSARNERYPAGLEQQKTMPLLYSSTWKNSRHSTDRRQGMEPTEDSTYRELNNGHYSKPSSPGGAVWTRGRSPSSAVDLKTASTATPGRPLRRHLETAPVPQPKPIQRRPIITTPPMSRCSPLRRKRILVVNVHSF